MQSIEEMGIRCVTPRWLKVTVVVGFLGGGYLLTTQLLNGNPIGWLFMLFLLIRMPFYSPDITVYQSGVEVQRLWYKNFLTWDDMLAVRVGQINAQIYPKGIPLLVRYALFDSILISKPRTNYDAAIEIIKEHRGNTDAATPRRIYEPSAK